VQQLEVFGSTRQCRQCLVVFSRLDGIVWHCVPGMMGHVNKGGQRPCKQGNKDDCSFVNQMIYSDWLLADDNMLAPSTGGKRRCHVIITLDVSPKLGGATWKGGCQCSRRPESQVLKSQS
jgi:hypothetical protein